MSRGCFKKSGEWGESLMSLIIFRFWTATLLTFLKNDLKLLKDKGLEIPNYGRTDAQIWLLG